MSIFGTIGKGLKSVGKVAGSAMKIAAPFAGMIPGVGTLAGIGLGAGGNALGNLLSGKKQSLSGIATSGAAGGAGSALTGGQGFKGLGNIPSSLGNVGAALKKPGMLGSNQPGGGFDMGKLASVGMAGVNMAGNMSKQKSAQKYGDAQIDMRNQLMSRLLSGGGNQQYNFAPGQ